MIKVLIIDDNDEIRNCVKQLLLIYSKQISREIKITEAMDGNDGIIKAERDKFNFIIVDYNMPRVTGIQVMKTLIRNNRIYKSYQFLFFSAEMNHQNVKIAKELGIRYAIKKPFDEHFFMQTINKMIQDLKEKGIIQ